MEIKDLNKLANMFFNKTSSAQDAAKTDTGNSLLNQGVSGSEFLAVLKQQSFGKAGVVEVADTDNASVSASAPVERNNKAVVSEKDVRSNSKVKDAKVEAKDDSASASQDVKDTADNKSDTRTENKDNSPVDKDAAQDNSQPAAEDKTSTAEDSATPSDQQADSAQDATEVPADGADNISAENSEASQAIDALLEILAGLGIQVADIAELSAMPSVTVFNPATNETTVMSGQDLLSMLTNAETPLVPLESNNPQADIVLQPVTAVVADLQSNGVDVSSLTPVLDKVSHAMADSKVQFNNQIIENTEVLSDDETLLQNIQSEAIAKVLPEDKKVSINVNVKEENFAYTSADDSVSAAVSAVVTEAEAPVDNAPKATPSNVSASVAPQAQAAMFANAQAQNTTVATDSGNSQIISGIKEVSTNQANLAQSGLEASHNIKNEQALQAENKNSSLRDVYKGMSKEVIDQIKVNITKSAVKGVDKIEIQLKPEDLGHIEIKMQISKDGKLQAHIISSRAETMDMLQKDMSSLEKAFNDAGFNTDEGSFSFSFRDNSHQDDNHQALRSFLGDALEQTADNENLYGEQASAENWDGRSALNIRV